MGRKGKKLCMKDRISWTFKYESRHRYAAMWIVKNWHDIAAKPFPSVGEMRYLFCKRTFERVVLFTS